MSLADEETEAEIGGPSSPALLTAGLLVGLYAMAPGFYLAGLHVRRGAEIVDHVVPGLAILAMVFISIVWGRQAPGIMLFVGVGILLAGIWMTDTHVGLVRQAIHNQAPGGATAYHAGTAFAVDVLGLAWLWRYRHVGSPSGEAAGAKSATNEASGD